MRSFIALVCGAIFGIGLTVSQMINPEKILAFLDIAGNWDPSLALVMGSAVGVTLLSFRFVLARPQPVFAQHFEIPRNKTIDAPLIIGAVLFGLGWGTAGYCPGPAIAGLTIGSWEPPVFVLALLAGNFIAGRLSALITNRSSTSFDSKAGLA